MFNNVLCLMGPTASGKTALAIELAKILPVTLISVDSTQIYQGLDIGAGKPHHDILTKFPHHLINTRQINELYSAGDFVQDALKLIEQSLKEFKLPCLVGGTMLYFKSLQEGLSELPPSDLKVRAHLNSILEQKGLAFLYQQLCEVDKETSLRIKPNDTQRIQRALEVYLSTNQPLSSYYHQPKVKPTHLNFINIALTPVTTPRSTLHELIKQRWFAMKKQGLKTEVINILNQHPSYLEFPSLRSVGYRQMIEHVVGLINEIELDEKAIAATRQLAKRQITWLNQWPDLIKLDFQDVNNLEKVLDKIKA